MQQDKMSEGAGIYIHVPFCERLCPYCDFAVSVQLEVPHEKYSMAVREELRRRRGEIGDRAIQTIYFGGGTPSLLAPWALQRLLAEVDELFGIGDDVEITLEANPNQVSDENLKAWRAMGMQRLSIGCQSFQDRHLRALRRNHSGAQAREAVERALSVMDRVSMDLMFAGPSQTAEEWEADLGVMQELVREQGLDHVSGYNLTIEPGTAFWIRRKRGTVVVPGEDAAAAMLDELVEASADVGLKRYEVSNFAAPSGESRHNGSYWRGVPYLGVGVGAHSLEVWEGGAARRRSNSRRYEEYIKDPGQALSMETLTARQHLTERLFLGVRSLRGVDIPGLEAQFGASVDEEVFLTIRRVLDDLAQRGWMERDDSGRYSPTNRGLNFSDSLAQWLFEAVD